MMTTLKNMVEAAKRGRWIVPGAPALSTAACGRPGPDTVAASGAGRLQLWIRLEAVDAVTDEVVDGLLTRFIEVLLLTDPVDAFWTALSVSFDGKPFKSLSQGDVDFGEVERPKDAESAGTAAVDAVVTIAAIKGALGDRVSDVRASNRLVDSAACLVAGGQGPDRELGRLLSCQKRCREQAGAGDQHQPSPGQRHLRCQAKRQR